MRFGVPFLSSTPCFWAVPPHPLLQRGEGQGWVKPLEAISVEKIGVLPPIYKIKIVSHRSVRMI